MTLTRAGSGVLAFGAEELATRFAALELSPVEVIEAIFQAVENDTRSINAFCLLDKAGALQAARESEQRYRIKSALSPVDGVPVSVKDLINVRGWPTRRGSMTTADDPAANEDSPAVLLMRQAGMPILGKTTTSEFGWAPISECPHSGTTRNPRDTSRSAGGSSSGAAAHVAQGWGPFSIGSDAGGSVRVPASYCGVVGFKPTHGAIPQAPQSALGDFAHVGPLTRNVRDCQLIMGVLSAPDPRDPDSLFSRIESRESATPPRIGWASQVGTQTVPDRFIAGQMEALALTLSNSGFALEKVDLGWLEISDALWSVWTPRVFESFAAWPAQKRALLDPRLQRVFEQGAAVTMTQLSQGRTRLREAATRLTALFTRIDLLITPTTPTPALMPGELAPREHPLFAAIATSGNNFAANPYCFPFNVTQQPAISIPFGESPEGLPFGLQIAGRKYEDAKVLSLARAVEPLIAAKS